MEHNPVVFLDSGVGGIPYCRHFCQRNPGVSVVYFADRLHFPYGKREKEELIGIVTGLVERIIRTFDPQIIVLACNTVSIAALTPLRERFPGLSFVGTVPAVKPAALASKTGKIGVLGTEFTIRESYIAELLARYGSVPKYDNTARTSGGEIIGIAAPELVDFVENRLDSASAEERTQLVWNYLDRFRAAGVDVLVLGCTHFLFLLDDFRREAVPDISVFESIEGISLRIESLLKEKWGEGSFGNASGDIRNRLLLTGPAAPEPVWIRWAEHLGFDLSLFEEAQA